MLKPLAAAAALLCVTASAAQAKPAYKKSLEDYFGPLLSARAADCGTCHAVSGSGEAALNLTLPKPHNSFGGRVMAVAAELKKSGGRTDIASRLDHVGREDSDGDGVSNWVELLTGHAPGLKKDRPTDTETNRGPELLAKLRARRSAYPWRPFETVKAPPVPRTPGAANPIDAFLAVEHRKRGLKPRPEAPREVLLRRVYLDLTGIPPTRSERAAFLADRSPTAYEAVVDRLLARPQYGERWARHWMDVWRYSDWDGYQAEVRNSQPHIWRWRDWIVQSLNDDKPYDRMVREMLAGDEISPDDPDVLPATGFLVRNWHKFNRTETLNRLIEGTGKAFLGVTLNCARCHDHKYDPISMGEFYRFRAIFEPFDIRTDRVSGQLDTAKDGLPRAFDAHEKAETFLLLQGDERKPDKSRTLAPGIPAALGGPSFHLSAVNLPLKGYIPDKHAYVITTQREDAASRVAAARRAVETGEPLATLKLKAAETGAELLEALLAVEKLEEQAGKEAPGWKEAAERASLLQRRLAVEEAELVREQAAATAETERLKSQAAGLKKAEDALVATEVTLAEARKKLDARVSTEFKPRYTAVYPPTSTGRRLALAKWITDPRNPLTARVAVNHLWLRHFGKALVPTVFDFGGNGQAPTHPALLDWLAAEFMRQSWSMKTLHRLMVTSRAYRMDSTYDAASAAKDPDNRYLWRMNSRRMEAEIVRDSLLQVSGELDPARGGPELDQALGMTAKRRSLYFRHSVEKQVEFLATFDQANVNECYERIESVVPQQALALANSSLALAASRVLAGKLVKEGGDFVRLAFLQILGRLPSPVELKECEVFLKRQATVLGDPAKLSAFETGAAAPVPPASDPQQRARENLVLVLLNHNEFVTIR